jgi:hypothetical protein
MHTRTRYRNYVPLLALLFAVPPAAAQPWLDIDTNAWREPSVLTRLDTADLVGRPPSSPSPFVHLPMFRMFPAYLTDPVGLASDDDPTPPDAAGPQDVDGLQVSLGNDNPFFDFFLPGDPGGFGYYKLHTQLQVLDTGTGSFVLGLQALTPAGIEADGLGQGRTFVRPAMAWYQAFGDGAAVHGFVSKTMRAEAGWSDRWENNFHYGLAVQHPLAGEPDSGWGSVHVFMEAIGQYYPDTLPATRRVTGMNMLPGLHWQVGDNWWLSTGVLVPMNTPSFEGSLLHITCSWRF